MKPTLRFVQSAPRGFTLIELMVGVALGLLVIAAAASMFASTSGNRREMERTGRQIENGRYAMEAISEDLANAGYFGELDPRDVGAPAALPDPCSTDVAILKNAVDLHIQGYGHADLKPGCLVDVRPNTAAIVVRRAATCVAGAGNCDGVSNGEIYLQSSLCNAELADPAVAAHYVVAAQPAAGASPFVMTQRDCATPASLRKYVVHIYYIANNNIAGDGVPTLWRTEIANGVISLAPLVEGIENLDFEYGLDTNGDGAPDAVSSVDAPPATIAQWLNAVTVNVHVLSRTTEPSPGYRDVKTYQLGLLASGAPYTLAAANDAYKRHVYSATVRMNNPAGRRE